MELSGVASKEHFHKLLDRLDEDDEKIDDDGHQDSLLVFTCSGCVRVEIGTSINVYPPKQAHPAPCAAPCATPPPRSTRSGHSSDKSKCSKVNAESLTETGTDQTSSEHSRSVDATVIPTSTTAPMFQARSPLSARDLRPASWMTVGTSGQKSGVKRKRSNTVEVVPHERRHFDGLVFYFCPNNDKDAARKMKINKAMQNGATWLRDWGPTATHVIADDEVTYEDLLKHLGLPEMPPDVVVVTQRYQDECLQYGRLLDPKKRHYFVKGYPSVAPVHESALPYAESAKSQRPKDARCKSLLTPPRAVSSQMNNSMPSRPFIGSQTRRPVYAKNSPSADMPRYDDALAEATREAKGFEHLPLDSERGETWSEDDEISESGSGDERLIKVSKDATSRSKEKSWQESFQCMHKHDGRSSNDNPNARTIEILKQMGQYYNRVQDSWRMIAYQRAVASLRGQKHKITTKEQALRLAFVGTRLAEKIEEIALTDQLRRLDNLFSEPEDESLQLFLKIYGVGPNQASRWVSQGFRVLDDLVRKARLTENQRIGIAHYDDFNKRIPREEVKQHGEIVRKALSEIDPTFEVTIMGSYRRGAGYSGDIDLMITKPGAPLEQIRAMFTDTLAPKLFSQEFLKASLAVPSRIDGSQWHGASAIPGSTVWRRIDFLFVPTEEIGAAMIYFTGNDIFNRSLRLLASKKGMRLNQRGLYKDCARGPGREKASPGTLVEGRSEKRIFEILGVPWRPPHHRIP